MSTCLATAVIQHAGHPRGQTITHTDKSILQAPASIATSGALNNSVNKYCVKYSTGNLYTYRLTIYNRQRGFHRKEKKMFLVLKQSSAP